MSLSPELKTAISNLPSKEKDKLLFRLLKKDYDLANRLLFELVSTDSVEDRREQAKKEVANYLKYSERSNSTGILHLYMRDMSGIISYHVKITKDKYGEIELLIWMMTHLLTAAKNIMDSELRNKSDKFCTAIVAKVFKILLLLNKMNEDLRYDFKEDLLALQEAFTNVEVLMKTAVYNGFDINWLDLEKLPDNIEDIYKDLKERDYLK
jgi:hypothetical protein